MVAVNSIEIPAEFVQLASEWYDGQASMLYAVASTGGLTLGSVRPYTDDEEIKEMGIIYYRRPMTDEEWYRSLWDGLESELYRAMKHDKEGELTEFYAWVEKQIQNMGKEETEHYFDVRFRERLENCSNQDRL
jgi:hypothetical protein